MAERKPVRDRYDAIMDFAVRGRRAMYALIKHTYRIVPGRGLSLIEPLPLYNDIRDPELDPRLPKDSDFWPKRDAADFVVKGSAVAEDGKEFAQLTAIAAIGPVAKRVRVTGPRRVIFGGDGRLDVESAPTTEVPMTWEFAYGGFDDRTGDPLFTSKEAEILHTQYDHPGLYPRNPFGRGYIIEPEPPPELWLPQLEDPSDLLSLDRLITRDSTQWWRQPLPWCFDTLHPVMYPRCILYDPQAEPWHPGPEDKSLPEIARGYLWAGYRSQLQGSGEIMHSEFVQESSHGMRFSSPVEGAPVQIQGMNAEHPLLEFEVPPAPSLTVNLEGVRRPTPLRLYKLLVEPSEMRVSTVYGALFESHRTFIPGIHPEIPIALEVEGDKPLPYEAPMPVRDQLRKASE